MLELGPDFILIIIEFDYQSHRDKNVPNEFREAFLGIGRGNPNFPKKIQELIEYKREVLYPIHFSLIKKPKNIKLAENKFIKRNTATGAMMLYKYLGLTQDTGKLLKVLNDFIKKLIESKHPKHFATVIDYKIVIGKDLEDV